MSDYIELNWNFPFFYTLFYFLAFVSRQIILAYIKRKIYNLNAIIKSFSIIATYFFHYILELYLSIVLLFRRSNTMLFRAFSSILKHFRSDDIAAKWVIQLALSWRRRSVSTKLQRSQSDGRISNGIKRLSTRNNRQSGERNEHISRRQSGAREIGAPRIPK